MRNDKHIAEKLRRLGKSYNAISRELDIPKSTLSDWFSKTMWSKRTKIELTRRANYIAKKRLRLINKKRREMWEQRREEAREEARRAFPRLSRDPLFVAGAMLYWGEGDSKLKNPLRLTNTNPKMIAIYIKYLVTKVNIPKTNLRLTLILYPDLSEKKCKRFWSKATSLPETQFYKTQFIKGRHPTARLSNGICMIACSGRIIKEKVMTWIDLLSKHL